MRKYTAGPVDGTVDGFRAALYRYIDAATAYQAATRQWEELMVARESVKREIARSVTPEEYLAKLEELRSLERAQANIDRPLAEYHDAGQALKAWFSSIERASIVVPERGVRVDYNNGLLSMTNLSTGKEEQPNGS